MERPAKSHNDKQSCDVGKTRYKSPYRPSYKTRATTRRRETAILGLWEIYELIDDAEARQLIMLAIKRCSALNRYGIGAAIIVR